MTLAANSKEHAEQQLPLFEMTAEVDPKPAKKKSSKPKVAKPSKDSSGFSDPAFAGNKTLPIHRWVPWVAGFSSDFVKSALHTYVDSPSTILDPFSGVGTTLIEASLAGHKAIGFEINPYAALACRVKLNAYHVNLTVLTDEMHQFTTFHERCISQNYTPITTPPAGFKTRADFYSPDVLHKVLILQDFIETIKDASVKELFKLAFSATMVRYSNYSYEPSLARRVSSGKADIMDFPVADAIIGKLTEMEEDISWLQTSLATAPLESSMVNGSFFGYAQHVEASSVDLIVTSPPYLNNYHYNRNTRPHLYWLGYASQPNDLKALELANFGKYWQTVRDKPYLGLNFTLPNSGIEEHLALLRSIKREKKVYSGNGWANYAASYFNDCYKFAQGIHYCLKPGKRALVVLGNSVLQGVSMPTDRYFGLIAESVGLELVEIHIPRATRVGSSIIQSSVRAEKAEDNHQLYEAVVELRKKP